jgi:hypothetical protein
VHQRGSKTCTTFVSSTGLTDVAGALKLTKWLNWHGRRGVHGRRRRGINGRRRRGIHGRDLESRELRERPEQSRSRRSTWRDSVGVVEVGLESSAAEIVMGSLGLAMGGMEAVGGMEAGERHGGRWATWRPVGGMEAGGRHGGRWAAWRPVGGMEAVGGMQAVGSMESSWWAGST